MRGTAAVFILTALVAAAQAAEYTKEADDFSNGTEHTVIFQDTNGEAALFVKCADEQKSFWVQIYIEDVIFPDDIGDKVMYLNVTHKFDTADSAHTGRWIMPMAKYYNAQYDGDERIFISEAISANRLAVKQNKTGAAYRFEIDDQARDYLRKVGAACGLLH